MIESQDPKLKGSFNFLNDLPKKDEILEVFSNVKKTLKKIERLDKKNDRKTYQDYKKILNEYKDFCKKYDIIIPELDYTKENKEQIKKSIVKLYNLLDRGISNQDLKNRDKKEIKNGTEQLNGNGTSYLDDKNNEKNQKDKFEISEINLSELTAISGIGNITGKKILDYLNNESISSIQDLENVKGVGSSTLEKIKEKTYLDTNKQSKKNNKLGQKDPKENKKDGTEKLNSKHGVVSSKKSKNLSKSNKDKLKKQYQEKNKDIKKQNSKSKETKSKETKSKETKSKETESKEDIAENQKERKNKSEPKKKEKMSQESSKEQITLNMENKSEGSYSIINDIKDFSKKGLGVLKDNKHWLGRTVGIGSGFFNPGIGIIVLSGTIIGGGEKDIKNLKKIGGGLKNGIKKFLSGSFANLEDDNELDASGWEKNIGSFINQHIDLKVHNEISDTTTSPVQLEDYVKKLGNIKLKKLRKNLQNMDKLESKKDLIKLLKKTSFLGRHDILTKYKYSNNLDKYTDNIIRILKKIANCEDIGDGKIKKEFNRINNMDISKLSFESKDE